MEKESEKKNDRMIYFFMLLTLAILIIVVIGFYTHWFGLSPDPLFSPSNDCSIINLRGVDTQPLCMEINECESDEEFLRVDTEETCGLENGDLGICCYKN